MRERKQALSRDSVHHDARVRARDVQGNVATLRATRSLPNSCNP